MDITQPDNGINLFAVFSTIGFSTFVGYAIGMALKKVMLIAVFILGIFFMGVSLLQYHGLVGGVDWNALQALYVGGAHALQSGGRAYLEWLVAQLPIAASATIGLLVGFKRS
jgi:uncharacterized membrane protein (Fun14 family)